MALVLADRVQETSATQGTGALTLAGPVAGFQSFGAIGDGNTTYYTIQNGNNWETGVGTYSLAALSLTRTAVLSTSNGNTNPINLVGSSTVWCDVPASASVYNTPNGDSMASFGTSKAPWPLAESALALSMIA